jgi:biopolymer transport protein TolR
MLLRERVKGQSVDRNVTVRLLIDAVKERQRRSPDQAVVISADKDVRYEAVLKVMDELQRADVKRVGLMVKPAPK